MKIPDNYHSAFGSEKPDLGELDVFERSRKLVFQHDVKNGIHPAFWNCDFIYTEPAWRRGYEKFQPVQVLKCRPTGHTWKSFAELLIASMPPRSKAHYIDKTSMFNKWWTDRGYPEGIPDAADYNMEANHKAPSWRRVCKSLLRNDYWCKGLGFSQPKSANYKKYLAPIRQKERALSSAQQSFCFARNQQC